MLIALGSVKASPGVTTLTVALAARWIGGTARRLVVECDPSGGDLAMRFDLPLSPGLVSLAVAHRDPTGPGSGERGEAAWEHVQSLPGGLPVLLAPPGHERARAAVAALTSPAGGACWWTRDARRTRCCSSIAAGWTQTRRRGRSRHPLTGCCL